MSKVFKRILKSGIVAQSLIVNGNMTMRYYPSDIPEDSANLYPEYSTIYEYSEITNEYKGGVEFLAGIKKYTIELDSIYKFSEMIEHLKSLGYQFKDSSQYKRVYKKEEIKEYKDKLKEEEKKHKRTYLLVQRKVKDKREAFVAMIRDDDDLNSYLKSLSGVVSANFLPRKKAYDKCNELNQGYIKDGIYMYNVA